MVALVAMASWVCQYGETAVLMAVVGRMVAMIISLRRAGCNQDNTDDLYISDVTDNDTNDDDSDYAYVITLWGSSCNGDSPCWHTPLSGLRV